MRELTQRLVPITLSQCIGLACGLVGVTLTSHVVPPDILGHYGVFVTLTPLGMWVIHAGLLKFLRRYWAEAPDRSALLHEIVGAAIRKLPWLVLATIVAAFFLPGSSRVLVWATLLFSAAMLSAGTVAQTALQAARQHWQDLWLSTVLSITRSFVPPLLYLAASGAVIALYAGFCLHAAAFAIAGAFLLRPYWRRPETAKPVRPLLTRVYEGPLFVTLACTGFILVGINRWLMAGFFGATETGYYSLASNIATILPSVLGTIFLQYFQPVLFAAAHDNDGDRKRLARKVDRVAACYFLLGAAGLLVLHFAVPLLVGSVIRETYRPALVWLVPAGCFTLATTTGSFYHAMLLAGGRSAACGPVDLTASAVFVAGCIGSAAVNQTVFLQWLLASCAVPWLINRPLARHYLFRADGSIDSPAAA